MKRSHLFSISLLAVCMIAAPLSFVYADDIPAASLPSALVFEATAPYTPGDVNTDGTVNTIDLNLLLTNYNKTVASDGWAFGDFNGDGTVNSTDLGLLLTYLNPRVSSTSVVNAVPEPSTLLLALVGLAGLYAYGRRRGEA